MTTFLSKQEFEILGTFGHQAFLARHPTLGNNDAVLMKEIVNLKQIADDCAVTSRLAKKICALYHSKCSAIVKLNHPNIIRFFGSFQENDIVHLVMEHLPLCHDLESVIEKNCPNPFAEEQLQSWARQLVFAVKFLHENGLVHGDIRPKNVLITEDLTKLKLGEFGLCNDFVRVAGKIPAKFPSKLVQWQFASPEFCRGETCDKPSDIWSLGVTLYRLAQHRQPFPADVPQVVSDIIKCNPVPFDVWFGGYSTQLRDFVMAMLRNKNPADRLTISQLSKSPFIITSSTESEQSIIVIEQPLLNWQKEAAELEQLKQESDQIISTYYAKIHAASGAGDVSLIKAIFEECRSKVPAEFDSPYCVRLLVEHRNKDSFDRTPLMEAALLGHLNVVNYLASEIGSDLWSRDSHQLGSMAIHLAVENGHFDVVDLLLQIEPSVLEARNAWGDTPLCYAVLNNNLMALVELLCRDKKANVEAAGQFGRTSLLKAASQGHLAIVRYLVEEAGANIEAKDGSYNGDMAIHLAAAFGHRSVVEYLLSKRPNFLEAADGWGGTALCRAAENGHLTIVQLLVGEKGANVNAKGQFGRTALHKATEEGHLDVVRYLVEIGKADVAAKDDDREAMAIHLAAEYGHADIVRYLLQRRPDLAEARNNLGETPLGCAEAANERQVIEILQQHSI